jgi:amidase
VEETAGVDPAQPLKPAAPVRGDEISGLSATALSQAIHSRALGCRELMRATLERIERFNPRHLAIVNLADPERLLAQADERDAELARGESRGWMHGMPQAVKDAAHAVGFPTTFGSPLNADFMPAHDSIHVQRVKAAGAIVIGKTNLSEFGLGSHSYNALFGTTRNAWDPSLSAGGSSGGAAVAVALRLLPVADGSDFMGSLRNPAGWNHVFGMRPSQGRVPGWPRPDLWVSQLATDGPMARTVHDLARLLQTQAGHDPRAPLSSAAPATALIPGQEPSVLGLRIGWLGDLGGHLAYEVGIGEVCAGALRRLAGCGAIVEPAAPTFDPAEVWEAWLVWRKALVAPNIAAVMHRPNARERVKPEALWEYDRAQQLSYGEFERAAVVRSRFYSQMLAQFDDFDLLALPSAQVWPFDASLTWPRVVAGREMDTYHRWMEVTLYATFAGLPAISLPAGFDDSGVRPMGLQLIGPPLGDAAVLAAARAYELASLALLAQQPPGLAREGQ